MTEQLLNMPNLFGGLIPLLNDIQILHNSHLEVFRSPFGAVPCEKVILLRLRIISQEQVEAVLLKLSQDGVEEKTLIMIEERKGQEERVYSCSILAPLSPCLLWYYFEVSLNGSKYYYGNNSKSQGGEGLISQVPILPYQITVYHKSLKTPEWLKDSIIYQIFVDRFFNGYEDGIVLNPKKNSLLHLNWDDEPIYLADHKGEHNEIARWSFFGGNLYGVRKKLPYLKGLGVKAIYFNPVFESPSNHKYDTGDYHKIDAMFGDNLLFEELCKQAQELGIAIILDGVFSHTGSDSVYFNKEGNYDSLGAYQSEASPYYKWYNFFGSKEYKSWWNIESLPNVNELDKSYQDFIINDEKSVLKYWMKKGIKGWRLDVADELPDEFIKNFYKTLKEVDDEAIVIGEVWEDASNKISYGIRRQYLLGTEMDSVMNYPFRSIVLDFMTGIKDAKWVNQSLMSMFENYPLHYFYSVMNLIGSHDVSRVLSVIKNNLNYMKLIVMWQMTFPGAPAIYYGDEAGLEGHIDPLNRGTYPWGRENKELLIWYKKMTSLRNHYDVFRTGKWYPLEINEDILGYIREIKDSGDVFQQKRKNNIAIVLINRSIDKTNNFLIDVSQLGNDKIFDILNDYAEIGIENGKLNITLQPLEGKIFIEDRWGSSFDAVRESGILLHPTSLPSSYGIGDLGKNAFAFVDFLATTKQKLWQILPLNPPVSGESPYQCFSAFAGNSLLIDVETLVEEGLLSKEDILKTPFLDDIRVDFAAVKEYKAELFKKAFVVFHKEVKNEAYLNFCEKQKYWLDDYALFLALKEHFNGLSWNQWESSIVFREQQALLYYNNLLQEKIAFHKFLQFKFFEQWQKLRSYANDQGIKIIGDIPIFVSHDSSDVWVHQNKFELDKSGNPIKVAGVPPDYFSKTGQLWGNPIYKWEEMKKDDYAWWRERFTFLYQLVDIIRIDHFRGFENYWEIPAEEKTAVNGSWAKGPGENFFTTLKRYLGETPVIAEDLGFITSEIQDLRIRFGFPGMKILQFADEIIIPLSEKATVYYTGSHDNDTLLGWLKEKYPEHTLAENIQISKELMEALYRSDAERVIFPLQDILGLGSEARMNIPGTLEGNWQWRFIKEQLTQDLQERLSNLVVKHHR